MPAASLFPNRFMKLMACVAGDGGPKHEGAVRRKGGCVCVGAVGFLQKP